MESFASVLADFRKYSFSGKNKGDNFERLKDGTAKVLNRSAVRGFRHHGELPHETLTVDNGRAFSNHESRSRQLQLDVYFAHPYHACLGARVE